MKFSIALPFFPTEDIEAILAEYREILEGRAMLTMGPNVASFESEFAAYVATTRGVVTNSCTSALEICLRAWSIGPGDEVIVPIQSFIASASCVSLNGATLVFCETNDDFLLDFEDMKNRITSRTKAVIVVHFAGLPHPDMAAIRQFCASRGVRVIEDAAHAAGGESNGTKVGALGDAACFSFFSTKNMTTGEGGMITTDDESLARCCASLRNRGVEPGGDVNIFSLVGSNRRMTEFQAILGRYQLRRLDQFVTLRNQVADCYREALAPLEQEGRLRFQSRPLQGRHAYWRFSLLLMDKNGDINALKQRMAVQGVPIDAPYTPLLHLQPVYRLMGRSFPRTERNAAKHFCLPMHVLISQSQAQFIAQALKEAIL